MKSFQEFYDLACLHKGGSDAVEASLPKAKSARALSAAKDNTYLSAMSLRVFRAGLKHEMVDKKWPAFEEVFNAFDTFYCAMLSDDNLDELMHDKRIIRHLGKIKSVRSNAQFIRDINDQHGGFGKFIAQWPEDDITGLWIYLKKHASQMGGMSGPYFLRMVGKDTFLFSRDVVAALMNQGIIDKTPSSQTAFKAVQKAFNQWREESGRSYCEISRVLSYTATV